MDSYSNPIGICSSETLIAWYEFKEEIDDFRTASLSHCDNLRKRALLLLKADLKTKSLKEIKEIRKWIQGLSDDDIFHAICSESFGSEGVLDSFLEGIKEYWAINRRMLREIKSSSYTHAAIISPFQKFRRQIDIIEKLIDTKEKYQQQKESNWILSPCEKPKVIQRYETLIQQAQQEAKKLSSPIDKIGQFRTRVENIMAWRIENRHIDELSNIQSRLYQLRPKVSAQAEIVSLLDQVLELVDMTIHDGVDYREDEVSTIQGNNLTHTPILAKSKNPDIFPENDPFIIYVREVRWCITFKESSLKWGKSLGDGNFIAHVWRPFLAHIEWIGKSYQVNFADFSWSQVIDQIRSSHEGIRTRTRFATFLDTLSQYRNIWNWRENWKYVTDAIGVFSHEDWYFHKEKWISPLMNFMKQLKENPPPTR
jgi:hypothetical protein